ncbi:MAG: helix-turn-helix domain-containing protein [Rhizomicrobium sp.]
MIDSAAARSPRADAMRNRERLLAAALALFANARQDVTLSAVAERAGVGIGTLYRHFPTRDALVEAVYRSEVERLSDAAPALLAQMPPEQALETWLTRYAALIAAKRGLKEALASIFEPGSDAYAYSRDRMKDAATLLLDAAAKSGAIRSDADPQDVLLAVAASTWAFANDGDWQDRARRVLRLVMDGLRYQPGAR